MEEDPKSRFWNIPKALDSLKNLIPTLFKTQVTGKWNSFVELKGVRMLYIWSLGFYGLDNCSENSV